MVFKKCRMLERLPVRTHYQPALALAWLAVMISTRSPPRRPAQRNELAVHLPRRHIAVADVGMYRVGEIDRGRAAWQRENFPSA